MTKRMLHALDINYEGKAVNADMPCQRSLPKVTVTREVEIDIPRIYLSVIETLL